MKKLYELPNSFLNKATHLRCWNSGLSRILSCMLIIFSLFALPIPALSQISLSISKSNNAPTPVQSGQPFTYTITYSWSGGAPGTLYIVDNVPASLDVLSALPGNPISSIIGNQVTFTLTGLTLPSGSGTVQINARFKPGVTCGGVRACNIAEITTDLHSGVLIKSNSDCVTSATPTNKWQFEKEWIAGCAVDDQVIFRIKIVNPAGSDIGGVNLTNINLTDILPAGAILQSVTGSWTGISGTNLTGGPTTLGVSPWTQWYVAYLTVSFPSPTFSSGQLVTNTSSMTFNTPCNQQNVTWTDTASVRLCQGVNQGSIGKYLSLSMYFPNNPSWYPVFTPGCCGTYTVQYGNTGTLSQNGLVLEDNFPPTLDLNAIRTNVPAGNMPVTLDVFCWTGSSCSTVPCTTAVYNTAGTQTMTGLPANVCKVRWTYSNAFVVSQYTWNYLDVCVRNNDYTNGNPVLTGQNIVNTITATATGMAPVSATHTKVVDAVAPKVVATKMFIGSCGAGCQVNPNGPFQPGDTVRFRMAVTNIGNANATTCSINDILPSGLSYVGNETYFFGTFNWMAYIYNPPCCSLTVAVPSQVGGTITQPPVGATNLTWTFPVLPGRCDGLVDYFIIDFDVKISDNPPAPPGQYVNTFAFSASNVTTVPSNPAYLTVNTTAQMQVIKEVKNKNSNTWSFADSVVAGGSGEFRLTVKNTGNTQLTNLCLLDIMPWVGDIKVLPAYNPRNSMFNLPYNPVNGAITSNLAGFFPTYSGAGLLPSRNPRRSTECGGFCGVADPAGAVPGLFSGASVQTYSFKINANTGVNLMPGATLQTLVPFKMPTQGVQLQSSACNSFAVQAVPIGLTNVCLSAESNTACVSLYEETPCLIIKERKIECLGKNQGNWVYKLTFNITNMSGTPGNITVTPNSGSVTGLSPTSIPAGVPTTVTGTYLSASSTGIICFTINLYDLKENKLCDTTFCLDLLPCPDPCPCPFQIKVDKPTGFQHSGNNIAITNSISVSGSGVMKVRASIASIMISQYCKFGGQTTYTPPATIIATNWQSALATGFGSSELTWTDLDCPPMNNANIGLLLNVPNAPSKNCWQTVYVCIRYTFTDCKCNTCDTTVCYTISRKWTPWYHDYQEDKKTGTGKTKIGNSTLASDENVFTLTMNSATEGKLTLNNPASDEFTSGAEIYSITLGTNSSAKPTSMKFSSASWADGTLADTVISSHGDLSPGGVLSCDIKFANPQTVKTWRNYIKLVYALDGSKDTISGIAEITSRIPSATGGDVLANNEAITNNLNAHTFAMKFIGSNLAADSIYSIDLKVNNASILAAGPGLDATTTTLTSFKIHDGTVKLLTASPDHTLAMEEAMVANSEIGPIYITFAATSNDPIILNYNTYNIYNELITSGSLELKISTSGIISKDNNVDIGLVTAIPNPASQSTTINFTLANDEPEVMLAVTDIMGKTVAVLIDNIAMGAGSHSIKFETAGLTAGNYFYTIRTHKASQTGKLIIIK